MKLWVIIFTVCLLLPAIVAVASSGKPAPAVTNSVPAAKPITNSELKKYFDDCVYHIPPRFTPDAREYYCGCTMSKIKEKKFTQADLDIVLKKDNWTNTNKIFGRFVTDVSAPCLDFPTEQIEYLSCVLDSSIDARINYVPSYCKCVATKMKQHARKYSAPEIMLGLGPKNYVYRDPLEAMWNNVNYIKASSRSRDECLLGR
jgi:hypothetical protein